MNKPILNSILQCKFNFIKRKVANLTNFTNYYLKGEGLKNRNFIKIFFQEFNRKLIIAPILVLKE